MNHVDLFSGIGGFSLAANNVWGNKHTVVCFVEKDPFCQKVLHKHWLNTPIVEDVHDIEKIKKYASGMGVDLLTGGFPCQPFSVAGKRGGNQDDRYLWPGMLQVIQETHPTWIIGENVPGIINMALDTVLSDLESTGYAVETFIIPACAKNAPHRRDRVWILAYSNGSRRDTQPLPCSECTIRENNASIEQSSQDVADTTTKGLERATGKSIQRRVNGSSCKSVDVADTPQRQNNGRARISMATEERQGRRVNTAFDSGCEDVPDTSDKGLERNEQRQTPCKSTGSSRSTTKRSEDVADTRLQRQTEYEKQATGIEQCREEYTSKRFPESRLGRTLNGVSQRLDGYWNDGWEDGVPRVAVGVKDRVNRLKALGNAIVPQIATELMCLIEFINRGGNHV